MFNIVTKLDQNTQIYKQKLERSVFQLRFVKNDKCDGKQKLALYLKKKKRKNKNQ